MIIDQKTGSGWWSLILVMKSGACFWEPQVSPRSPSIKSVFISWITSSSASSAPSSPSASSASSLGPGWLAGLSRWYTFYGQTSQASPQEGAATIYNKCLIAYLSVQTFTLLCGYYVTPLHLNPILWSFNLNIWWCRKFICNCCCCLLLFIKCR